MPSSGRRHGDVTDRDLSFDPGTAVLFLGGCPGGRAATSAYLGILCRVAKGGARSRPSAAVPRLLLVAGTRSYVDCR
jgi:hypothetical protein